MSRKREIERLEQEIYENKSLYNLMKSLYSYGFIRLSLLDSQKEHIDTLKNQLAAVEVDKENEQ